MGKLKRLISTIIILLAHCPFKTVYINFKTLPFKQALRLPIFVYSKTEFRSIKGRIVINGSISPNMIHIGDNTRYPTTSRPLSIWTINGRIIFNGPINFLQGTYVYVAENATLQFGTNGTFVGSDTKIICRDRIDIGNCVEITWECQIYDTSFHYIIKGGGNVPGATSDQTNSYQRLCMDRQSGDHIPGNGCPEPFGYSFGIAVQQGLFRIWPEMFVCGHSGQM